MIGFTVFAAVCDKSKTTGLQGRHEEFLLSAFGAALEGAREAGLLCCQRELPVRLTCSHRRHCREGGGRELAGRGTKA